MFSLPSLAPSDSYTLWYTSSNSPNPHTVCEQDDQFFPQSQHPQRRRQSSAAYISPLMQLRLDEEAIQNRKKNITDFGAAWLKPPGVPKSLQQLREEEREMKEHQEALRREQIAQELAMADVGTEMESFLQGEEAMEQMPDLDADIPEADNIESDSDSDDDQSEADINHHNDTSGFMIRNNLAVPDDLYRRETLVRDRLLRDDSSSIDEKELPGMLQEEDLAQEQPEVEWTQVDLGMDHDMDLDNDLPDGEGYEHTDTEEEVSISEDDDGSI